MLACRRIPAGDPHQRRCRAKGFRPAGLRASMNTPPLTVEALADYCRTQAGLLAGQAEQLETSLAELLDRVGADIEAVRDRLDARPPTTEGASTPPTTGDGPALADIEAAQDRAVSLQARVVDLRTLAADYQALAATLADEYVDAEPALERVVGFEIENDAPAHTARETLAETLAKDGARD